MKRSIAMLSIIIILAVVIGGGYLLWRYFEKNNDTAETLIVDNSASNKEDTSGGENNQWQTYENSRYQFSVNYPASWQLGEEPTNNDGREFISPDKKTTCRAFGFQNALLNDNNEPQTLAEYISWLKENPDREIQNEQNTKMANQNATELLYTESGKTTRAVYILGTESGRGLTCDFIKAQDEKEFRENFTEMKESFSVNASL